MNFALIALTCLILGCKFIERDDSVPLIEDMIKSLNQMQTNRLIVRSSITYEQVLQKEIEIMCKFEWRLHKVTVWSFLENYIVQGLLFTSDSVSLTLSESQAAELYQNHNNL